MARLPHHSSNYGGKRPGAGRPKGSVGRVTQETLKKAAAAKVHPVDLLLEICADTEMAMKDRMAAASALLPYCAPRLASTEVNVNHDLSAESQEALVLREAAIDARLIELGLKQPPAIEARVLEHDAGIQ